MTRGKYYSAHLHMHSNHESSASMEGHMYQAQRIGVDIIWFTDHDHRIWTLKGKVSNYDFENRESLTTKNASNILYGWVQQDVERPATSKLSITDEIAYQGSKCLKFEAAATEDEHQWQSAAVEFFAQGKRHQRSLLALMKLEIACLIDSVIDKDARIIFEVKMSQQPPEHKVAKLKYIIGNAEGLFEDCVAAIGLDAKVGEWQEFLFNISEDVENYPVGGQDNVFGTLSIILEVRNGKKLTCYFDDFQILHELAGDPVRNRQRELANILGEKYGVIPFIGTEISFAGHHKNCFSTHVPLIDYETKDFNVSHEEAIEWVKKHNGTFSINHPFNSWAKKDITEYDRRIILKNTIDTYSSAGCYSASLIEIGFPEGRHNFSLKDYLELWDGLSKNGIFITGYGDSDNHGNSGSWWNGNNFAAWIYAEEPTEDNLIQSMRNGNVYTGDPAIFKGTLSFKTLEGYAIGQVIKTTKSEYTLVFQANSIEPGWTIQWVVDGIRQKSDITLDNSYHGEITLGITEPIHFARVEIYNENGRCIILTNPIYFVTGDTIEIPEERKAVV